MNSSLELRSKKELIEQFIATINNETKVYEDWRKFVAEKKEKELWKIIEEEKLKKHETETFMENAFRDGEIKATGLAFDSVLPAVPMFTEDKARAKKKQVVLEKFREFFEKYFGI
jgi:type I restriction enzyme R subunit